MKTTQKFYKLARPDGWDFHTGKTINYRKNIGKEVVCPGYSKGGKLCTSAFIHASRKAEQCFVGAKVPCSAYRVWGIPILEDDNKCGFGKLSVEEELKPEELFKWNYAEAANPTHPFQIVPPKQIQKWHKNKLRQWDSVRDSVRDSVWDSVGASVRASVRASVGASVRDSVWASVRDSVRDSVWASVWASVRDSVWASVWAYVGWIFKNVVRRCVRRWRYIDHKEGEYPFQSVVDLWFKGLVPSYDGTVWRLHGGKDAAILWEGEL